MSPRLEHGLMHHDPLTRRHVSRRFHRRSWARHVLDRRSRVRHFQPARRRGRAFDRRSVGRPRLVRGCERGRGRRCRWNLRRNLVRTGSRLDSSPGASRLRCDGGGSLRPTDGIGSRSGTCRRSSSGHLRRQRRSAGAGAWSDRRDHRADRPSCPGRRGAAVRRGAVSPGQIGANVRRYEWAVDRHTLSSRRVVRHDEPERRVRCVSTHSAWSNRSAVSYPIRRVEVVVTPSPSGHREAAGARSEPPLEPASLRLGQAPSGRMTVEGRVISVQARESERWGTRYGMVLRLQNGTTVWSSVPRSLDEAVGMEPETLRGHRVRFTATFEPSGRRFAFARRPRDAQML